MAEDEGWGGAYKTPMVNSDALHHLRDMAGPPPSPGKKWFMVDLFSGECKWYTSRSRNTYSRKRKK